MSTDLALQSYRARGYSFRAVGGTLDVSGPSPRNEAATLEWLRLNKAAVLDVLAAEAAPQVVTAAEVLGCRLRGIRLSAERRPVDPEPLCAGPGQPTSWRNVGEFRAHLEAIGARLYRDPVGLVLIAPATEFTVHVAAGLRKWRESLSRDAISDDGSAVERNGERWLRV